MKYLVLVLSALILGACGHGHKKKCDSCGMKPKCESCGMKGMGHKHGGMGPMAAMPTQAAAILNPIGKGKVTGSVQMVAAEGMSVRITYNVKGLKKNQSHGIHIHEFGDCTSADGAAAGGHFNPTSAPHAGPDAAAKHMGDLGNLTANGKGEATGEILVAGTNLHLLVGRSLIVHAGPDDLTSQPAGNSGDRVACGVIGVTR